MATPVRRIVNASPLNLLARAGQLELLRAGVPEILVPDAVLLREVSARGPADPVLLEVQRAGLFVTDDLIRSALGLVGE